MFISRTIAPAPRLAYTDYTPVGPWTDGQTVTRNYDGVGFTYSASLNALTINPNLSASIKNANNFKIQNVPDPTANLDAANKEYVDSHAGSGGGIPEAPTDGQQYGRQSSAWSVVVPNPAPSTTTPLMDGTAAVGTGTTFARADHAHPSDTTKAPLVSPTFTGTPAAPTPTAGTNTTQLATTAFVGTAITNANVPPSSTAIPAMDGTGAAGTATAYSRGDHVHPTDTSRAPLASPIFTGTPQAPTPATADNSVDIATTAFVKAQGYAPSGSVPAPSTTTPIMDGTGAAGSATAYARGDHVHPSDTSRAPLVSPTFTGVPAAPTPATADNSTTLATTAFVKAQGYIIANQTITLSGDITGSGTTAITTTLPTVNANVGTFQGITVNGKGLVTGAVSQVGTANPLINGAVAVGTSLLYSRQDHVHPVDTSRAPNTVFVASGASHAQGLVPDPGATAGTARFLREDATWATAGGVSLYIQDTAPTGAPAGALWWNSTNGQLYAYYNDGTSIQWVCINPTASLAAIQYDILQGLSALQQVTARQNAGAPPFDAMMSNNIVLNGAMEVSQENGTTVVALVNATAKYICDQWQGVYVNASAVFRGQQATPIAGPAGLQTTYSYYIQCTTAISTVAAGDFALFQQPIEGLRFMRAQFGLAIATSITVSFWVYCTVTGTFSVTLRNGSTANRSYVTNIVYTTVNTWQFCTATIPGDIAGTWAKDNTWAVSLGFCFCCGTTFQTTAGTWQAGNFFGTSSNTNFFNAVNNTVYVTGVALHIGTEAPLQARSGYLWRPYQEELILCKRYWQKLGGDAAADVLFTAFAATSGSVNTNTTVYPVEMRAIPVVNIIGTWTQQNNSGFAPIPGTRSMSANLTANVGNAATAYYPNAAGSYLSLSARL
jgi:hypothetical protein